MGPTNELTQALITTEAKLSYIYPKTHSILFYFTFVFLKEEKK